MATIFFAQIAHILGNFCKVQNFHFSSEIILGNFHRHLVTFYWSRCTQSAKEREIDRGKYFKKSFPKISFISLSSLRLLPIVVVVGRRHRTTLTYRRSRSGPMSGSINSQATICPFFFFSLSL